LADESRSDGRQIPHQAAKQAGLEVVGAWPQRQEYASWLEFVDVVRALGGFDPARDAAEADVTRRRVAQFGSEAFTALDIASQRRHLDLWHDIDSSEAAARTLTKALFMGRTTAGIAAAALSAAPPDIAVPLLEDASDLERAAASAAANPDGFLERRRWPARTAAGLGCGMTIYGCEKRARPWRSDTDCGGTAPADRTADPRPSRAETEHAVRTGRAEPPRITLQRPSSRPPRAAPHRKSSSHACKTAGF
jgi:hypothetical protein